MPNGIGRQLRRGATQFLDFRTKRALERLEEERERRQKQREAESKALLEAQKTRRGALEFLAGREGEAQIPAREQLAGIAGIPFDPERARQRQLTERKQETLLKSLPFLERAGSKPFIKGLERTDLFEPKELSEMEAFLKKQEEAKEAQDKAKLSKAQIEVKEARAKLDKAKKELEEPKDLTDLKRVVDATSSSMTRIQNRLLDIEGMSGAEAERNRLNRLLDENRRLQQGVLDIMRRSVGLPEAEAPSPSAFRIPGGRFPIPTARATSTDVFAAIPGVDADSARLLAEAEQEGRNLREIAERQIEIMSRIGLDNDTIREVLLTRYGGR